MPTFRADIRMFELPDRKERWFGGGADLTPFYLVEADVSEFHRCWRQMCTDVMGSEGNVKYAEMKKSCDDYFFIPARNEVRGVGGIFFDQLRDLGGSLELAENFVCEVAAGFMPSYLPIVERQILLPHTTAERRWQLLRRGRYLEFNLLYDRGVRFGLAQLEKVMVSAPPLIAWEYGPASTKKHKVDEHLLEVLREPREWAFSAEDGELAEFMHEGTAVTGVLPRSFVMEHGLRCRGIGVLVLETPIGGQSTRLLCHRRAETKATFPGKWDMLVGGLAAPGEASADAAARELAEEIGIERPAESLHALGITVLVEGKVHCLVETFAVLVLPGAPLMYNDGEVAESEWVSLELLRSQVVEAPERWVDTGLTVWRALEDAGGIEALHPLEPHEDRVDEEEEESVLLDVERIAEQTSC